MEEAPTATLAARCRASSGATGLPSFTACFRFFARAFFSATLTALLFRPGWFWRSNGIEQGALTIPTSLEKFSRKSRADPENQNWV